MLEQQGERNRAEKLYERIAGEAPEASDAVFRLGYLRLLRGDYPASAMAFQLCIERRPEWSEAWLNAGIAFARCGDPVAARRHFQEALMLCPDSAAAVRGLAAVALEQQDYAEAFDLHCRLIELGERSAGLYYNAGLLCQQRGMPADAVQFYRQALAEDPQFADALLHLGQGEIPIVHRREDP